MTQMLERIMRVAEDTDNENRPVMKDEVVRKIRIVVCQ